MIRRRLWVSLLGTVAVAVVVLGLNVGFGVAPVLGLDLQGGVSVVLRPTEPAEGADLIVIRDLIRDELEQRGIAEPDVRVEGPNIIVDLPGVRDQRDALDAVDVAGIVTLRPVFGCVAGTPDGTATTTTTAGTATTSGGDTATTAAGDPATTDAAAPTTVATTVAATVAGTVAGTDPAPVSGFARNGREIEVPAALATPSTPPTPTTPTTPTTVSAATTTVAAAATTTPGAEATTTTVAGDVAPTDAPTDAPPPNTELLPQLDGGQCLVGPSGGTGEVFNRNSANVRLDDLGRWAVVVGLSGAGEAAWNSLAFQCFNRGETCPSQQLAIVLDDVVQSAPVVEAPSFTGEVSIAGTFSEGEARSLSRVLNRGAFPVNVEPQTVQTVSPTLGKDSMRASVFAGLVGVAAVLLLLAVFYRRLTLVVIAGLAVWGMLIYSVSALISQTTNYALTLAGVTGIIVSIGMTVDSYVIYFERLKDEARHGRTIKNSSARSFKATWRTILAANLVSAIGAAVLFVLSVGSVRGFALYLGITTICDVIVLWFFTRPAVILLAGTGRLDRRNTFGLQVRS